MNQSDIAWKMFSKHREVQWWLQDQDTGNVELCFSALSYQIMITPCSITDFFMEPGNSQSETHLMEMCKAERKREQKSDQD